MDLEAIIGIGIMPTGFVFPSHPGAVGQSLVPN